MKSASISRAAAALIIIMLVVLVGIVGYAFGNAQTIFSTETTTVSTTTTVVPYLQVISLVFAFHLQKMELRNASGVAEDYAPDAVLVWEGNAQGLEGTYRGGNISIFWCSFLCHIQNLLVSNSSYSATINSTATGGSTAFVNSTILVSGRGTILGNFSGIISLRIVYDSNKENSWLISNETWNFLQLTTTGQGYA